MERGEGMSKFSKRIMITLLSEWEPMLEQLKKETFYNDTQAAMFRYIISCGLATLQEEKRTGKEIDIPDTCSS